MAIKIGSAKKSGRKLRLALFGKDSVGKTFFGLDGPADVIVFDSEGRIAAMNDVPQFAQKFKGEIPIIEFDERNVGQDLVDAARAMRAGQYNGPSGKPFETFVVDSWTTIEKLFVQNCGIDTIKDDRVRIRNLGDVRKRIENEVLNPAFTGPTKCHMVVIAHEANEWSGQQVAGGKPDATRNFKHYFDIVFHMQRERTQNGQEGKRVATVVKSNYAHILPIGTRIENLTWNDPRLQKIIAGEVEIVAVPNSELNALFQKAKAIGNLPEEKIGNWLKANGFEVVEGKISPEDSHRAKGLLETIIEEASSDAKELAS